MKKDLEKIPKNVIYGGLLVAFVIVMTVANVMYMQSYVNTKLNNKIGNMLDYNREMAKEFDLKVSLKVQPLADVDANWYEIPLDEVIVTDFPEKKFTRQEYFFKKTNLDLQASWSYVHLYYFIEKQAYEYYLEINCTWVVEDTTTSWLKSFNPFSYNGNYYARYDETIENALWKTDVPDTIEAVIVLYSR